MKTLQDIFSSKHPESLDLASEISSREVEFPDTNEGRFSDLRQGGDTYLHIGKKRSIGLSPQVQNKSSDALCRKNMRSQFQELKYKLKIQKKRGEIFSQSFLKQAREFVFSHTQRISSQKKSPLPLKKIPKNQHSKARKISVPVIQFSTRPKWQLSKIFLVVFCFAIIYAGVSKYIVESRVNTGFMQLMELRQGELDEQEIASLINSARFNFLLADILFSPFGILPSEKTESVDHLINSGRSLSRALDKGVYLYSQTKSFTDSKDLEEIYFSRLLLNIYPLLEDIHKDVSSAVYELESISWLPDQNLIEQKEELTARLTGLQELLGQVQKSYPELLDMLGHKQRAKYLIVFQNADEIRPTGGFMGSMGYLELYKGQMKLFQKKDVYAIEWDLKSADYERLSAPKGLDELTDTFGLRDANYYASVQTSSEAIEFFTGQAGIDLDGIIYLNQNIILEFLDLLGPIHLSEYDIYISSDNFSEVMSLLVESKISKQGTLGTPKQVLFDFMGHFSQALLSQKKYLDYASILKKEVKNRDLVIWSFDEQNNQALEDFALNGAIDFTQSLDFIYPVYTSLSGNKSDRYMHRSYNITVDRVPNSCNYDVSVSVKNSHNMPKSTKQRIRELGEDYQIEDMEYQLSIQGNARNRQYVRIILPSQSFVNLDNSYEVVNYGSRMGVELFHETQVQESSYYDFSYTLENPSCKAYDFTLYKQAGIPSYDLDLSLFGQSYQYTNIEGDFYFQEK